MRGAEVLSAKEPPFVVASASSRPAARPARGWGTPWVPHAGLENAHGCCWSPRDPSLWHTAGQYAGSRNVVNFTMKNPKLHGTVGRA